MRGGKRNGAGRKAGPAKTAITVRIKQDVADKINAYCKAKKLSQARAIEAWANRLNP